MPRPLRIAPACYHVLHLVPPVIAHELGYFAEEGLVDETGRLTYELAPHGHAPFMFEKVALGQTMKERGIDITVDVKPSTIAYMQAHGHAVSIIAGWRNQMPELLIGQPGLTSLGDLRGKRIGVIDLQDVLMTVLSYWLLEAGLDPRQDVEWVRGVEPRRAVGALRAGAVEAAFANDFEAQPLFDEGFTVLLDVQKQYPAGRPDRVIAATDRAIDERPDAIKSFIKGMVRAYWFMRKQPENLQVVQSVERRLRRQSPDPDEPRRALQFASAEHSERMPFPFDGLPTGLERYFDEAVSMGVLDTQPAVEQTCRLELARAAFAELAERADPLPDLERAKAVAARLGY